MTRRIEFSLRSGRPTTSKPLRLAAAVVSARPPGVRIPVVCPAARAACLVAIEAAPPPVSVAPSLREASPPVVPRD